MVDFFERIRQLEDMQGLGDVQGFLDKWDSLLHKWDAAMVPLRRSYKLLPPFPGK